MKVTIPAIAVAPWPPISEALIRKLKATYPDRRPRHGASGPEDPIAYTRYCGMVDLIEMLEGIRVQQQEAGGLNPSGEDTPF